MKNAFKFGFLALVVSVSVVACDPPEKKGTATDSSAIDSSAISAPDTSVIDSAAKDTALTDTTKKI